MPETGILTLGGREFAPAQHYSFGRDIWMMNHVHAAGLDQPAESDETFINRVLSSGRVTKLLAGALDETGVEWTEERAEANAKFFYALDDPVDIQTLRAALVGVLADFFLSARDLWRTFQSSSEKSQTESPNESEEISSSATGEPSSETWPDSMLTASESS